MLASVALLPSLRAANALEPVTVPPDGVPAVAIRDGRLWVRAASCRRSEILRAITAAAGMKAEGVVLRDGPITIAIADSSVPEVMTRVLDGQGFGLVVRADGTPRRIVLLPEPERAAAGGGGLLVAALRPYAAALAAADRMALDTALARAVSSPDSGMRAAAASQAVRIVDGDAGLSHELAHVLGAHDPATLAAAAADLAGDRAAELVVYAAAHTTNPMLRTRAAEILRALRRGE